MRKDDPQFPVSDISPLGGNIVDGTTVEKVPLVYDQRVGAYISQQAVEELDERDYGLKQQEVFNEEAQFRAKIGYRQ